MGTLIARASWTRVESRDRCRIALVEPVIFEPGQVTVLTDIIGGVSPRAGDDDASAGAKKAARRRIADAGRPACHHHRLAEEIETAHASPLFAGQCGRHVGAGAR